jgi:CO/xanthine dehydrogenase Mo-binding subunit
MMGHAAIQAAEKLKAQIAEAAAEQLEVIPGRLVFSQGKIFVEGEPGKGISFREGVQFAEAKFGTLGAVGSYSPPRSPGRYKGAGVGPSPAYSYSACVVEVEVDKPTGWIAVPRIWIAHDIGRTVNPVLARGQVEGSVYMGLAEALMEEQVFRRLPPKMSHALVHKIPSLLEYKSPTSLDMPEVETILVEDPDPNCPFGAKEAGQGPLLPVMPAVANAIYDAVGVRIDEIPITPDKLFKALELRRQGKPARVGPEKLPLFTFPEPIKVPSAFGEPADATVKRREPQQS